MNIIDKIFGSRAKLSREALLAYFHRLPDHIQVKWFRDGNFIVGEIQAGENKFVTQGKDAADFIEMVNDAVVTLNSVPKEYINIIRQLKTYNPSVEEEEKLRDLNIKGSITRIQKDEKVLRPA